MQRGLTSYLPAVGVCVFAFGLAVYDLEFRSMWYDEWLSWNWSQMNPVVMTVDTAQQGGHPPTYYAFLWLWTRITMTQQLSAMRLSSVLFGVLAVALTYRLTLRWFQSEVVALVAALTLAVSSPYVYFMRELRMYTLMVLLVVLSWWAFDRFVRRKRHGLLLYTLTLALMAYTYYFTVFIAALQLVMLLLFWRGRLPRAVVVYAGVLLLLLPWVPFLRVQIQNDAQYAEYGLEVPGIGVVAKGAATQGTDEDSIRSFIQRYTNEQPYFIGGLVLAGTLIGGLHYFRPREQRRWYVAALLWLFGTTLIFFLGNLVTPLYNPRYLLMIVPALGIVIGLGVVELPRRYQWLVASGLVIFGMFTHTAGFFGFRTPHNELLGTVAAQFEPGDKVWYNMEAGARGSSLYSAPEYYLAVKYPNLTTDDFVWDVEDDASDPTQVDRVWDVRDIYTRIPLDMHNLLMTGRRVTEEHNVGEFRIRLYETPPQTQPAQFGEHFGVRADVPQTIVTAPGEMVPLKLWFDVANTPELDYSLALHLRTPDGDMVTQLDNTLIYENMAIDDDSLPTSQWQPGDVPYFIPAALEIPADVPAGTYDLWLTVYHWQQSPTGLVLTAGDSITRADNFLHVASVTVE